jgi:hypothetical protein
MNLVFPEVVPGDALRISASTFQNWKRCPGNAEARLRGLHPPESRHSFAGSLAHRLFKRHLTDGPIPEEEFAMVCRQEIGSTNLKFRLAEAGLRKISDLEPLFDEARDLYRRFRMLPAGGFREGEVSLEHPLPDAGITLVGVVDAVFEDDGGVRLVDWKTGGVHDPEAQMGFYAMLWALARGELPAAVEALSVRSGEVYRDTPTWETARSVAEEVAEMVSSLRTAWERGGDADRYGGPWCSWCPVLEECPEGQTASRLLD